MIIVIILGLIVVSLLMQGPLDHLILGGICAGVLVAWRLATWIISAILNALEPKKRGIKNKELERIKQAEALDEENSAFNKEAQLRYQKAYEPLYAAALDKIRKEQPTDPSAEKRRKEYKLAKEELAASQVAVKNSTVLAPGDKNLETVDFLIQRLESRRADSVKEALNQMDEAKRRNAEEQRRKAEAKAKADLEASRFQLQLDMQRDMQRMERDRQAQWELDEMQRQWRRDQQAREHQKEMEWKAQQAQWELEEINRKLGRN